MKWFTRLTICLLTFCMFAVTAGAHSFETNGTIGALMHAEPGDSPVAGKQGNLYFYFTDKLNQFQPGKCACRIVVKMGSQLIMDRNLFTDLRDQQNGVNVIVPIKFARMGEYQITVTGNPKMPGGFQPFSFDYEERVDHAEASWIPYGLAGAMLIGVTIILGRRLLKRRNSPKQS